VWPTENEASSEAKLEKYAESVKKIANDPRIVDMDEHPNKAHGFVFTIREEDA
jgi:hypothetical protein